MVLPTVEANRQAGEGTEHRGVFRRSQGTSTYQKTKMEAFEKKKNGKL